MTREEAKHKLDFMKKAYQKLIDEKVDSGKLVGDGVSGEWKTETPLDEAYKSMIDALEMAIKALEPQYCGDCISREETLKALMDEWTEFDSELMDYLIEKVKKLPSVTPQPKMGRWILQGNPYSKLYGLYKCSGCGAYIGEIANYCSECGSYNGCDNDG